jgi:hypothetical protein
LIIPLDTLPRCLLLSMMDVIASHAASKTPGLDEPLASATLAKYDQSTAERQPFQ